MKNILIVLTAAMAMVSGAVQAAITAPDLASITTAVTADIAVIIPWALALLGLVLAPTLGFKLLKRFSGQV